MDELSAPGDELAGGPVGGAVDVSRLAADLTGVELVSPPVLLEVLAKLPFWRKQYIAERVAMQHSAMELNPLTAPVVNILFGASCSSTCLLHSVQQDVYCTHHCSQL